MLRNQVDPKKIEKLKLELGRLNSIGGGKIVPNEGIVFLYKGNTFKLTAYIYIRKSNTRYFLLKFTVSLI